LISGGRNKKMSFDTVRPFLIKYVKQVYLIGEMSPMLLNSWRQTIPCRECISLANAVQYAISQAIAGDIVLLSPGCSSLDMFENYKHRGESFTQEVKRRIKS
jgi:UDP-N-acetylmuramoylalanine--D-glutamate ligase